MNKKRRRQNVSFIILDLFIYIVLFNSFFYFLHLYVYFLIYHFSFVFTHFNSLFFEQIYFSQ